MGQHKSDSPVSVGMGNAGWECLWRPLKVIQAQIRIILEQAATLARKYRDYLQHWAYILEPSLRRLADHVHLDLELYQKAFSGVDCAFPNPAEVQ